MITALRAGVKTLLSDLIRKRLWPVAAALVLAIVAVPVLLAASAPSQPAPGDGAAAGASLAAAAAPAVAQAVDREASGGGERSGHVRDPFFDPPTPPPAQSSASSSTNGGAAAKHEPAPPPAASSTAEAPSTPDDVAKTTTTTAQVPPAPDDAVPAKPAARVTGRYYRTTIRVGTGARSTTRPLARLSPLGGRWSPAALYLGVMNAAHPYAVFLLGGHATAQADANCDSSPDCRLIALSTGDTQTITVRTAAGAAVRRFTLRVGSVQALTTTRGRAAMARAAVHPDGRRILRAMWRSADAAAALRGLTYRQPAGRLVSTGLAEGVEKPAQ